jgi:hypothetical protein
MKRITCQKCKKRRIPWWNKWLGDSVEQWIICRNTKIKIVMFPGYTCGKCVEDIVSNFTVLAKVCDG